MMSCSGRIISRTTLPPGGQRDRAEGAVGLSIVDGGRDEHRLADEPATPVSVGRV
jgi:hypothetical protein